MPRKSTSIAIESNNQKLSEIFLKLAEFSEVHFEKDHGLKSATYCVYLADLSADITSLSQEIIELIQACQSKNIKIAICLVFAEKINIEKVSYLKNLLGSLNQSPPLYRLLLIRDLYQDVLPQPVTFLDKLLWQSIQDLHWHTSTKGKNLFYPLYINDLVTLIIKTLFLNSTAGKTFWVFGDKYTDLEMGFLLKSTLSDDKGLFDIESDLTNYQEEAQFYALGNETQIVLGWRPDTDFEQKLKSIIDQSKQDSVQEDYQLEHSQVSPIKKKIVSIKNSLAKINVKRHGAKLKNRFLAISIKILFLVLFLYAATAGVFAWSMSKEYASLNRSLDLAGKGELEKSVLEVKNLRYYNRLSEITLEPIKPVVLLINPQIGEELVNLFAFNNYLALSLENLQQTYVLADKIYKSLHDTQTIIDPEGSILALQSNLALVYENLIQIKVSLESKKLPERVVLKIKKSPQYAHLGKIDQQLTQAMKLTEGLPVILKPNKTTKLGVLIQDQDEIRPTGGLIKQLIVFTIESGRITEVKTWIPENIDAVALGEAKAPEMLARVTGSDDYKFKDMNYPADFSQTAEYIIWFLDRTIGLRLDSLVGLNKSFFEKMINENNALEINGQVVTAQDLRSSSSDTDSSKAVVDYYLTAFNTGKLSLLTLGRSIISEIEEGNIKLFSSDETAQTAIARLPISGIVSDFPCHSGLGAYRECLNQVTYLNESNLIYAPVNHSLKRDVAHSVTLGTDRFNHEYRLKYSFKNDFGLLNRPYQLIYQLFTPSGSEITKIEVDGQTSLLKSGFTKMKHGQSEYFQIPLTFSPSGDHEVFIGFDTPLKSTFDPAKTALSFTEIRQPGATDKGTLLMVKIAENTRPLAITHEIQIVQGSLAVQLPPQTTTFGLGLGY